LNGNEGTYPTVIATSVVRGARKGESHGGIFLVDLHSGRWKLKLDWAEMDIEWEGSGRDRGLRGIAFYRDLLVIASSSEMLLLDQEFNVVDRFTCPYMFMCHEIVVSGDELFISSTGYDSILVYDFSLRRFTLGYRIVFENHFPNVIRFDPEGSEGPDRVNSFHINNVFVSADEIFFSGLKFDILLAIGRNGRLRNEAKIVKGTHNVRRYRDGLLMNDTPMNDILFLSNSGEFRYPVPRYDPSSLIVPPGDYVARQQFGRGLVTTGDLIIAGSAPSTISLYRFGTAEPLKSVNLTMDIRHSIHGLEIWPFGKKARSLYV
jgi:hypothetical protein